MMRWMDGMHGVFFFVGLVSGSGLFWVAGVRGGELNMGGGQGK